MNDQIPNLVDSCKPVPMKDGGFDHTGFLNWLNRCGAEIGIPTNPYEMIRYRALSENGKPVTHVIYRRENGSITWPGVTASHYRLFLDGMTLPGPNAIPPSEVFLQTFPTKSAQASLRADTRQKLLDRDGNECWFCGKSLGDDCTIEHLVPKSSGGRNMLANYALAHRSCNNRAGNLPLIRKIEMRHILRGGK